MGLSNRVWRNSLNVLTFTLLDAKVLYQMAVGIKFDDVVDFSLKSFGKVNFKETKTKFFSSVDFRVITIRGTIFFQCKYT